MSYVPKNYNTDGGDRTVIGGILEFGPEAQVKGFPGAENFTPKTTNTASDIRADLNKLITGLKDAGIVVPDTWELSVKAAPSLPIANTAANSAAASVAIDGNVITITADLDDLVESDHGETWGKHKWIGFGVDTGLDSVVGITFNDGTAAVTLTQSDADEAISVGLSAGDFVLYVKAEKIAAEGGMFTLKAPGYAETRFALALVPPANT